MTLSKTDVVKLHNKCNCKSLYRQNMKHVKNIDSELLLSNTRLQSYRHVQINNQARELVNPIVLLLLTVTGIKSVNITYKLLIISQT